MSATGHRQIDHTADLALEIWAPSQEELLGEAARAVTLIMIGGGEVTGAERRHLAFEALDAEDRLVHWVNEIIYLAVTEGFLFAAATISLGDAGLEAELAGEADAAGRLSSELKAATYHDLLLQETPGGWRARLVIDV